MYNYLFIDLFKTRFPTPKSQKGSLLSSKFKNWLFKFLDIGKNNVFIRFPPNFFFDFPLDSLGMFNYKYIYIYIYSIIF